MSKKTIGVFILIILAAFLMSGCYPEKKEKQAFCIYLITMDQTDQHWVNLNKGVEKGVKELGNITYKWIAPDVKDDTKQIECINNAVAGGADAIIIAANSFYAVTAALEEADKAGVKIIYVDSPAKYQAVATFATDNKSAGKIAGEEMLRNLKENYIMTGKIGIIGVSVATESTLAREEGFREAFKGTPYELLETQYGDGDVVKSKDLAANLLTQGCVGLFGTNEGGTVGVGNAIQESEENIVGVGFDKSDTILQLIKNGYLICTIAQNPEIMGYKGVKTAYESLLGQEESDEVIDTGISLVTKEILKED